jgi:hypothetical protein
MASGGRTVAIILALTVLLAALVGLIGYRYEEKLGGFAYLVGEATAVIVVIGLIVWGKRRRP